MKSKRMIFYHDDADGRCAAAIARGHAKLTGWERAYAPFQYGDLINWQIFENFKAGDTVWILDFSFKAKEMEKLCDIVGSENITWIDHHIKSQDLYDQFKHLKGVRLTGEAACILTWRYCFGENSIPKPVLHIGDRDIWRFAFGDDTKYFYEKYLQEETEPWREVWDGWLDPGYNFKTELVYGKIIYHARMKWLKDMARRLGREHQEFIDGVMTLTVNFPGSGDMGQIIQDMGYLIAHCYEDKPNSEGRVVRLHHLYSDTIDVGEIARAYGGGGHKEAAGWDEEIMLGLERWSAKHRWTENFTPPIEDL